MTHNRLKGNRRGIGGSMEGTEHKWEYFAKQKKEKQFAKMSRRRQLNELIKEQYIDSQKNI